MKNATIKNGSVEISESYAASPYSNTSSYKIRAAVNNAYTEVLSRKGTAGDIQSVAGKDVCNNRGDGRSLKIYLGAGLSSMALIHTYIKIFVVEDYAKKHHYDLLVTMKDNKTGFREQYST